MTFTHNAQDDRRPSNDFGYIVSVKEAVPKNNRSRPGTEFQGQVQVGLGFFNIQTGGEHHSIGGTQPMPPRTTQNLWAAFAARTAGNAESASTKLEVEYNPCFEEPPASRPQSVPSA